jgi:hypothetical protein
MTNDANWRFERRLDKDFMEKLKLEAKRPGWFADVLADTDLVVGIRKNYVNVYRLGQSLFKIERGGKTGLKFSTHPKYLLDPDLYKAVSFDGSRFAVDKLEPIMKEYSGLDTLKRMKKGAGLYSGEEKRGVHAIIVANPNVVDTEIAFGHEAQAKTDTNLALSPEEKGLSARRIDLACFEAVGKSIRLRFWEAKLYKNSEIKAKGDSVAQVIDKVTKYRSLVQKHREEILQSYRVVAENLVEMSHWSDSPRKVGELVKRVADGALFDIDEPPIVGLIVYGYDAAQEKSDSWKAHLTKLKKEENMPVELAGDAKKVHLVVKQKCRFDSDSSRARIRPGRRAVVRA